MWAQKDPPRVVGGSRGRREKEESWSAMPQCGFASYDGRIQSVSPCIIEMDARRTTLAPSFLVRAVLGLGLSSGLRVIGVQCSMLNVQFVEPLAFSL